MDTNVTSLPPDPGFDAVGHPQARLPGEAVPPGGPSAPLGTLLGSSGMPVRRRRGRTALLAGVALLGLAAAGCAFLVSPYNTVVPVDAGRLEARARQLAASAGLQLPPLVAPAARLAALPRPEARPALREEVAPQTAAQQAAEIRSLRREPAIGRALPPSPEPTGEVGSGVVAAGPASAGSTRAGPEPVAGTPNATQAPVALVKPSLPEAFPVMEVGSAPQLDLAPPPAARVPVPALVPDPAPAPAPAASEARNPLASRANPVVPSAARAKPGPSTQAPPDAVDVAVALQPSPMSRGEQIDVLHAVAQLGIVVRDLRVQNAALRASVQASAEKLDGAVADFERRLALAEARGALNAAMGADPGTAPAAPAPSGTAARTVHLPASAAAQQVTPQPGASAAAPGAPRRYKVQAASPALAMLSELDRSGGEGSQVQVGVGDQVPGLGKVTSIQQRGSSWTVVTDRGSIQ